jgi:uncharacterized membrane-anchored protein
MISLSGAVTFVLFIVVGGLVVALLIYAINYCEKEFPNTPAVWKVARIAVVLLTVFVLIGMLISLISGQPFFRNDWRAA